MPSYHKKERGVLGGGGGGVDQSRLFFPEGENQRSFQKGTSESV
jgi:hypothetical protein